MDYEKETRKKLTDCEPYYEYIHYYNEGGFMYVKYGVCYIAVINQAFRRKQLGRFVNNFFCEQLYISQGILTKLSQKHCSCYLAHTVIVFGIQTFLTEF